MNRDFSLFDAQFARAREGLRVLDELARFLFRDRALYEGLRTLRHRLAAIEFALGDALTVAGRERGGEPGVDSGALATGTATIWQVIRSNAGRVTEALRVLQDVGALYNPGIIHYFQDIRYELYFLEKELLERTPQYHLRRLLAQGVVYPIGASATELAWFIGRGARIVQLRNKEASREQLFSEAKTLLVFIQEFEKRSKEKVLWILNDYPELAARLPMAGVHIGQDYPVDKARRILGSLRIIGRSNQSIDQMKASAAAGADYVSLGPVFSTPHKPDRPAVGLRTVARAAKEIVAPWVAIGGINKNNFFAVYEAGCRSMALVRGAKEFFS